MNEGQYEILGSPDEMCPVFNETNEEFDTPAGIPASTQITKNFKKGGKSIGTNLKFETDLLGHPVAGSGGDEYNPQSEKEHEETFKSFNEHDLGEFISLIDIKHYLKQFIKSMLIDPSNEEVPELFQKMGLNKDDLIQGLMQYGIIDRVDNHGVTN